MFLEKPSIKRICSHLELFISFLCMKLDRLENCAKWIYFYSKLALKNIKFNISLFSLCYFSNFDLTWFIMLNATYLLHRGAKLTNEISLILLNKFVSNLTIDINCDINGWLVNCLKKLKTEILSTNPFALLLTQFCSNFVCKCLNYALWFF